MSAFLPFRAHVTDSGGGTVTMLIDRDAAEYPSEGADVVVSPRAPLRHVGWVRRHTVRYDGGQQDVEELLPALANHKPSDRPVFELRDQESALVLDAAQILTFALQAIVDEPSQAGWIDTTKSVAQTALDEYRAVMQDQ